MSRSREDIIEEAAKDIVDHWHDWEAEADQISQCEQDSEAGAFFMKRRIEEIVDQALRMNEWRTTP